MDHTTGFRLFFLLAGIASPIGAARAHESETQVWLNGGVTAPLASDVTAAVDLSERLRDGPDQLLVRGTIDWKLSPRVSIGGGIAYITSDSGDEVRPHQYVNLSAGNLSLRSMLEERFLENEDRPLIRLRERAQWLVPVSDRARLAFAGEVYFIFQSARRNDSRDIEQYRASAAVRYSISPNIESAVTYLMIYAPIPHAPDRLTQVPQVSVAYKF